MPNFNQTDFSGNPVALAAPRSKFAMNFKHKTTWSSGLVVPIFSYGDVLPGDTWEVDLSSLVRMTTPVFPTMDDAFIDVYFFFTPHKLTLSRQMMSPSVSDSNHSWAAFIGAQDSLLNMPTPSDVTLPFVFIPKMTSGGYSSPDLGSLADYLGLPISQGLRGISCLEPLAYYSVWNNYFRDENTQNPVTYTIAASGVGAGADPNITGGRECVKFSGFDGTSRWGVINASIGDVASVLPACRPHGYFGSCLPWPQRNTNAVTLPLGDYAPVYASKTITNPLTGTDVGALDFKADYGSGFTGALNATNGYDLQYGDAKKTYASQRSSLGSVTGAVSPSNLVADLESATAASINTIRYAFAAQRFYEALARGGNRIGEMTAAMFGVTPSDLAQDRPEYLGGKRIPITMDQVANTAGPGAGGSGQTLGSLGAYSNTGDSSHYFVKSFDTWGTITAVCVVRTNESFCQGIPRRYTRKNRLDFYWRPFAMIGEQPVRSQEIYAQNSSYQATEADPFGYQEAWAEYRFLPDIVSGHLRPDQDLGAYTYCNDFGTSGAPTLAGYLDATGVQANIDRTLVVPGSTAGFEFIGDFAFKINVTRAIPTRSLPGLIDHY